LGKNKKRRYKRSNVKGNASGNNVIALRLELCYNNNVTDGIATLWRNNYG